MEKTTRIGDVGDRVEVSGVVLSAERVETEWGNSTRIKITNIDGVLAWWLSSHDLAYDLTPGQPITVRATIMRYVVAEGKLWVQITRGRILENALALA